MSFMTKIAVAFRAFKNADHLQAAPEGMKSLTHVPANRIPTTHVEKGPMDLKGFITPNDLIDLNSMYIRNAVAQLGAWTAIAKGFSAYLKNPRDAEVFVDEFHAWNAVTATENQMDEEATLQVVAKLTVVKPQKGNDQTDAIIARVRKVTVDEVRADREAKAQKEVAAREEAMLGYTQLLWSMVGHNESEYKLAGSKAVMKALDTMEWIASWTGNPAQIAGELLLCEADVAQLERIAKKEAEREGESQATFG
jgi:hypothetical protein